jgi:DNA-binding MarR family transcriptional regulator/GNAT superfamily N-acetyltransferase
MEPTITAVRRFNRFYTQHIGALDAHFLGTDTTLAEARLLFEIAQADAPVAADLQSALGMDAGYVSRVLARFERRGWISRDRAHIDARRRPITLTEAGRAAYTALDTRQRAQVAAALTRLNPAQRTDLTAALATIRALLDPTPAKHFTIRTFRPGDMGLITARQAILYAADYGWGTGLEINIAETTADFLRRFTAGRDQCWLAEIDGALAGSIFLTDEGRGLSRLRLLYVEPFARGRGVGDALIRTCIGFARTAGYRTITLWTHTILTSARRLYAAHGFRLTETATHETFGTPVQGETWQLDLAD